jgi:hypothetical protein
MADNSGQNINQREGARAVISALTEQLKLAGDYNDIVSDSIKLLKKAVTEYDNIEKKLDSLYDGEINIKKIQEQRYKANLKERISENRVAEISKRLTKDQIRDSRLLLNTVQDRIKAIADGNDDLAESLKDQIESQGMFNNVHQQSYVAAMQQLELSKQQKKEAEEKLKVEKSIQKSIGLSGGLMKIFADKIGIGNGVYDAMVKKARELNEVNKKSKLEVLGAGLKEMGKGISDSLTDPLAMIPLIGGAIGGIVKGFKAALDFILEIEDRTVKFGRALGYSREESFEIAENFGNLSTSTGNLLITTQNLLEVQTDLSNQLGVTNILSDEMLTTQIELKKIMGLSADEMGSLAQASIISGKGQKETVVGIVGQVAGLKQATGISFNYKQIIGEVTKLSGVLGLRFAKFPQALTKSAIVTKALGMDLAKVDQIAGSLLNFEESIQNQLEAQLITGKNINLSRAQQLALEGDTAGVAIELSKQFGTANEYLEMNRIQQESIAKAVGMTREDLADTLKNQEMLTKLSATDTKEAIKKLEALKAQGKTQEQLVGLLGEGAYQNLTALSAQEKIAALIDKVKGAFQDFLTKSGVVEWVTGLIHKLTSPDNVKGLINTLKEGVAIIADVIQGIAVSLIHLAELVAFGDADAKLKSLRAGIEEQDMGGKIRSLGSVTIPTSDFIIKPLKEDTITMAGGTKLGRTDEMVDLLRQILSESKQGKSVTVSVDGQPLAVAVARNASLTQAASNLGPRPLR